MFHVKQLPIHEHYVPAGWFNHHFPQLCNGYVPILLNYGFENNKLKNYLGLDHHVEHLTHLKPQLFIENGILDWNKTNKLGLTIDVTAIYNGSQFSLF